MIGREIQPERDRWSKRLDSFQLERTDFNGEHVVFDFLACDLGKRFTNVAAGNCLLSAIVQHLSKHFRRGRFAVGSGNCDDGRFARTPAELELADDLDLSGREILCQHRSRIASDRYLIFSRATSESGLPMLPQAIVFCPQSFSICASISVVVVLPFVPVIAMTGVSQERQPSSSSPMMSILSAPADSSCGERAEKFCARADVGSIPGLATTKSYL